MKKLISIFITGIVLYLAVSGWNILVDVSEQEKPAASTPAVTSGQAEEEEEDLSHANQTYIKSTFVDMSGKKQVLDLGWVDLDNRATMLSEIDLVTEYSQILDGHYYYLRESQTGKNIILYRDKGEKVMETACDNEKEVIQGAALDRHKLYLIYFDRKELFYNDEFIYKIKSVDLKTGVVAVTPLDRISEIQWIREQYIYAYDHSEDPTWRCFDRKSGKMLKDRVFDDESAWFYEKQEVDGKVYYMKDIRKPDQPCSFIQVDLEKKKKRTLFEYVPKLKKEVHVDLEYINEEGIYFTEYNSNICALYKVPLQGGKMKCIVKVKSSDGYSVYKNHLVYTDKKNRMHYMNLKKHTDTIIGKEFKFIDEIYSLECGKEGVFIVREADWMNYLVYERDDDKESLLENSLSFELYFMDYNGKNIKQLTKEVPFDVPSS